MGGRGTSSGGGGSKQQVLAPVGQRGHLKSMSAGDAAKVIQQDFAAQGVELSFNEALDYRSSLYLWSAYSYSDIRTAGRGETPKDAASADQAKRLEKYLSVAPTFKGGTLYRGVGELGLGDMDTLTQAMKNGSSIDMGGLSSWTTSKRIADDFAMTNGGGAYSRGVVLKLPATMKGTSIQAFAMKGNEKEVLVSSKAKYKITKIDVGFGFSPVEVTLSELP